MNGQQHIPTQRPGKVHRKCSLAWIAFVVLVISLYGCIGRGDWDQELVNGYTIIRSNAHSIQIWEVTGYIDKRPVYEKQTLKNFFIKHYCYNETYIGIIGTPTAENLCATDAEVEEGDEVFYLINSATDEIYGPYAKIGEYTELCESLEVGEMGDWCNTFISWHACCLPKD